LLSLSVLVLSVRRTSITFPVALDRRGLPAPVGKEKHDGTAHADDSRTASRMVMTGRLPRGSKNAKLDSTEQSSLTGVFEMPVEKFDERLLRLLRVRPFESVARARSVSNSTSTALALSLS